MESVRSIHFFDLAAGYLPPIQRNQTQAAVDLLTRFFSLCLVLSPIRGPVLRHGASHPYTIHSPTTSFAHPIRPRLLSSTMTCLYASAYLRQNPCRRLFPLCNQLRNSLLIRLILMSYEVLDQKTTSRSHKHHHQDRNHLRELSYHSQMISVVRLSLRWKFSDKTEKMSIGLKSFGHCQVERESYFGALSHPTLVVREGWSL